MNKAVIFDMDGVIVNSEPVWESYENKFLPELMGEKTYLKIKNQILGNSISKIYETSAKYGFKMEKTDFIRIYHEYAAIVYQEAEITEGLENLLDRLIISKYTLGLVSVSRQDWIELVLNKLNKKNLFKFVLSIDSLGVRPKPFPDGYIMAIRELNSTPDKTIIIEDSQRGVTAAKASGALTICFTRHLPKNYKPIGADFYVKDINELMKQIERISKK